jgi:caa(3)-type oxidase subunit IV
MAHGLTFEETKKEYLKVFAALLTFTVLTVIASLEWVPHSWGAWGTYLHVGVGILIALVKAAMVVWIFMHIKFDNPYLRAMILVPMFFFTVLLLTLTTMGL